MKIYLLYGSDEDGPVDLVATIDKTRLPEMAEKLNEFGWFENYPTLVRDLAERIKTDINPGVYPLMSGWGGLVLHVVDGS